MSFEMNTISKSSHLFFTRILIGAVRDCRKKTVAFSCGNRNRYGFLVILKIYE